MVYGPAAEVFALAALALATDRYAMLGRELLEFGIAIIERAGWGIVMPGRQKACGWTAVGKAAPLTRR